MRKLILSVLVLFAAIVPETASQQVLSAGQGSIDIDKTLTTRLFNTDEVLEITLSFDITTLRRKRSDTEYLDAVISYLSDRNDTIRQNIKVRARGNYRRSYCDFPPIHLNFKLKDTIDGEFAGIDKIKLVPYCNPGNEDYVLREYLVYKLYNVLTDFSLKVRLLRINFVNTSRPGKPMTQYGFVIEPVKVFEKRTLTREVESGKLTQNNIIPGNMDRYAIFSYMIGNPDWSVASRHNVLIFYRPGKESSDKGMIVGYDFDFAGIVNTDYAVPAADMPIKSVRERVYMGMCRTEAEYRKALEEFIQKKDEFYSVIDNFPYLRERSKKDMKMFLESFYSGIDKRNTIIFKMSGDCEYFFVKRR